MSVCSEDQPIPWHHGLSAPSRNPKTIKGPKVMFEEWIEFGLIEGMMIGLDQVEGEDFGKLVALRF